MKLPPSRELFAYWESSRGSRPAPDRADIDPGAIRRVLGDTFILTFDRRAGHPFRLAGTRVCALFGRELKNHPFLTLWGKASGDAIADLVTNIAAETVGAIANASGVTADGDSMELELLLLPLLPRGPGQARLLGSLTPVAIPYWLGVRPLERLTLGGQRYLGPAINQGGLTAAGAPPANSRPPFVVYEGGRRDH